MALLWRIEMFGGLRVQRLQPQEADGQVASAPQVLDRFRSRQAGALLAFVAYFPRQHARELLCELLWPGHDAELSRRHLRVVLSSLRKCLEPPDVPAGSVVAADRNFVGLDSRSVTTDVAEFEATLQQASQATSRAAQSAHLAQAVECYRGVLLPGFYEDWVLPESQRLEEAYFAALRRLIRALEQDGAVERALHYARRGLSMDALREDVGRDVMRLYAAMGQPALALRQYYEMERVFKSALNAVPGPQTRELMRLIESESSQTTERRMVPHEAPDITPAAAHSPASASLVAPDAKTDAARPASVPGIDGTYLPPQWSRFFGRKTEIAALKNLWSTPSVRLVTLTGPGGSGKTRLALETARLWREQWQPEITLWFVPLAEVSHSDSFAAAIAEIVGGEALWPGLGPSTSLERLLSALQEKASPVLVLDNLEHLLPAGAALVQTLLQRVPALRILATSRHPLEIAAEAVFEVPLMLVPLPDTPPEKLLEWESIQLFHDRARLVRPGFKISRQNGATVVRLCERLEGWPLAIEFCAAHAAKFAPWQMLQRLEHRLDFLTPAPDNNVPERHSTLRVMLKWSYELLWAELRQFFAELSVFRGGGTTEAAAIVTHQPHAAHFLDQLHAASLVRLSADGRFFLLETVREFAREQLSDCEQEELQRRHANYFLEMVNAALPNLEAAASQRRLEQMQRLKVEHDNFRVALEWSLEHDPVMALYLVDATSRFWADLFSEAHNLAEQALEKAMHLAPPPLVSSVLSIAATAAGHRGDYRRQSQLSRQRLELACEIDDEYQIAWAWFHVGASAFETGEHEAAERAFHQALQIFRFGAAQADVAEQTGKFQNVAWTLNQVAMCAAERRDWEAAERYFVESGEIFRRIGDQDGEAGAFAQRGDLARQRGDLETARRLLEQSEAIEHDLGDMRGHPWRRIQSGRLAWAENRPSEAARFFGRALSGFGEVNDLTGLLNAMLALACLDASRQPPRAAALLSFEEMQRQKSGLALPSDWYEPRQQTVETLRSALSEADLQAATERGHLLTLEEAVNLAREAAHEAG
ncbi:MAG TPA: BTAD domain-containing putative transcriptional regulator [Abditibacteriaceae bacterium]|jgi:predicted ATPase/DNA-binding SARP family transcriptional activator